MTTYKKAARCANTGTAKTAGQSTKARTTILLAAARFCNWLVGEIGLAALMVFGLPPLVGLAPWLPLPLLGGAVLTVSAGLMEEVLECAES